MLAFACTRVDGTPIDLSNLFIGKLMLKTFRISSEVSCSHVMIFRQLKLLVIWGITCFSNHKSIIVCSWSGQLLWLPCHFHKSLATAFVKVGSLRVGELRGSIVTSCTNSSQCRTKLSLIDARFWARCFKPVAHVSPFASFSSDINETLDIICSWFCPAFIWWLFSLEYLLIHWVR